MSESLLLTPPEDLEISDYGEDSLDYMDFFEKDKKSNKIEINDVEHSFKSNFGFNCNGSPGVKGSVTSDGYLKTGMLQSVLSQNFSSNWLKKTAYEVIFNPANIYFKFRHHFKKILMTVYMVEENLQTLGAKNSLEESINLRETRQKIVAFYCSLLQCLENPICSDGFCHDISQEIIKLLHYIGPLKSLPSFVTKASSTKGNACSTYPYHLFHLHLDIRWWSLCILNIIENKKPYLKPPDTYKSPLTRESDNISNYFNIMLTTIIWDLMTLLHRQVSQENLSNFQKISAFPCTCSYELAVSIMHIANAKQENGFWNEIRICILQLLKEATTGNSTESKIIYSDFIDTTNFIPLTLPHLWWMFLSLAKLFCYNVQGETVDCYSNLIKPEPKLLRTFILVTLKTQPDEMYMRYFLICSMSFLELWKEDRATSWLSLFWDHLAKQLNSNFLSVDFGLEGLACLSKSPSCWINQISSIVPSVSDLNGNENSWQIFLRIVVFLVKNENEWKIMKGRLYSKFHEKKMSELSPVGLYNTASLFLTLAVHGDANELCTKLVNLLNFIQFENSGKQRIKVIGLLAIVFLLLSKGYTAEEALKVLRNEISKLCQDYKSVQETEYKRDIGQIVIMYAEGIVDIVHNSDKKIWHENSNLFCTSLNIFLNTGLYSEKKSILMCINCCVQSIRKDGRIISSLVSSIEFINSLWKNFALTFKDQMCDSSPQPILAEICASLIIISCRIFELSQVDHKHLMDQSSDLFIEIIDSYSVSHLLRCKFITSILQEKDSSSLLFQVCDKFESKLFSSFLFSLVHLGNREEVITASEAIFKMSSLTKWVEIYPNCPFDAMELFLKTLSDELSKAQDFKKQILIRESAMTYFASLEKVFLSLLKKTPPPSHAREAMLLLASFFEYGFKLLYIKGKSTCPLIGLLSSTVLIPACYSDKPLDKTLSEGLEFVLPKVLFGLSKLSPTSDPCISRRLKDVILHYIHRYPINNCHPFYIFFTYEQNEDLVEFFLVTLKDGFLLNKKAIQVNIQVVFDFLQKLLSSDPRFWLRPCCNILFLPTLELLLRINNLQLKRSATNFLEDLLTEWEINGSDAELKLCEKIYQFTSDQLSWYHQKVFSILAVLGCLNRRLIMDSLPKIFEAITIVENKRGAGENASLRSGYHSLVKNVRKT